MSSFVTQGVLKLCAKSYCAGCFTDIGLANFLGLATLRHGTNPYSWVSIHMFGADPSWGGSKIGGDYGEKLTNRSDKFFMLKDYHHMLRDGGFELDDFLIPRKYTALSTINFLKNYYIPTFISYLPMHVMSVYLPVIKFRFNSNEIRELKRDYDLYHCAVWTDKKISPLKVGIIGTIHESSNIKTLDRMSEDRIRVVMGISQLALTKSLFNNIRLTHRILLKTHKICAIASYIFGIV